jgi:2-hydroxymuconate-semialdehyde hydrolase
MVTNMKITEHTINIDSVDTHYLEAGDGYPAVLLHSGEYGACAELSWERNIETLAEHFRVIAPDWLGYGKTDKLYDFEGGARRRISHMRRVLAVLGVEDAIFIGSSMGASVLAREVASGSGQFDAAAMVLSAGGGFVPNNPARETIVDYDCTIEGMRRIVDVLFHDDAWAKDDEYVRRRHESSLVPGAWEVAAAARFRSPVSPPRNAIGQPDSTPYEQIPCPTLLVAGRDDPLREPGYAEQIAAKIPVATAVTYDNCGHLPHIEAAERFNVDVIDFLTRHGFVD